MKKLLFCLMCVLFMPVVSAGSFSISSSATSVSVGSSVTIYVKASDAAGRFSVSSSNSGVMAFSDDASSVWLDNSNSSFKFTAKSAGSAVITVTPSDCAGYDEKEITGSKSITINVKNSGGSSSNGGSSNGGSSNKKTVVESRTKSSINYLSSLSVEGFELSPAFDKEVTEYDVTLPNGTSSIKVTGNKESDSSYVTGLGDVSVSEGVNTINVEVSAENGAKRTYVIRATVEEEEPIIVNIDGSDYTVIRKSDALPSVSDYYTLGTITIGENEIPAYSSEVTHYNLVGLKDNSGNIFLYRYDNGNYLKYEEYGFSSVKLSLLKPESILDGYTEGSVTINEKDVVAYIKDDELPLLYGINVETGEVNYYSYDKSEGTLQKYVVSDKKDNTKYYPIIIFSLAGFVLVEFIIIICVVASKNKKKDLYDKVDKKEKEYKDEKKEEITDEDIENKLGHTALISSSVGNVFDSSPSKDKKSKKKNNDDDMYNF